MNRTHAPRQLLELPASHWREVFEDLGERPYRGDQIARWVFSRRVFDFAAMTDLPVDLRQRLAGVLDVTPPAVERVYRSVDGSRRYLLRVGARDLVEAVYMPYAGRVTFCISSQVGCRFACTFCQTGMLGLARSLSAGEIVGQVLRLQAELDEPARRTNVVFMGQGEPLDNVAGVLDAVVALQDPLGPALSWRRITVSTVGLPPAIRKLAVLGDRRPRLAVSLNATTDEVRSTIMPVNRKYPIETLLAALREIDWRNRERLTFEYVLLAGINDSVRDARRLGGLVHGLPAKVNLIPWNPIASMPYRRPEADVVERFRMEALSAGVDALVRYSRGADIGAACGQLQADAGAIAQLG